VVLVFRSLCPDDRGGAQQLDFVGTLFGSIGGLDRLNNAYAVVVDPDGAFGYVAADHVVVPRSTT
jgi:hypothetical protein